MQSDWAAQVLHYWFEELRPAVVALWLGFLAGGNSLLLFVVTVGAAVLGPVFFDESLTLTRAFWLAVIIAGVVWLKLADSPGLEARKSVSPSGAEPQEPAEDSVASGTTR